MYSSRCCNFL